MIEDNNITKIGLNTPEDILYDNSYTKDFINWLESDKFKEVKTITWFEYESL